jgi:exopolyphosphatase/guanosine-5'-triphosphate,3'-diphosphate pyrophosphatase
LSRVAAIDCGTNSIRLLIADIEGENFREIVREMQIVRLGEGVDATGEFKPEAIERTLVALRSFAEIISSKGVEKIRFCATSATRDAKNRNLFVDGVKEILGIEPEVISGQEEAELSFSGAVRELKYQTSPYLVVDIGGGSTEFVLGDSAVQAAKSVNIGCVRMRERYFSQLPPTPQEVAKAVAEIDYAIAEAAKVVPLSEAKTIVAVAGTATTVAAAALELPRYDRYSIHLAHIPVNKVLEVSQDFLLATKTDLSQLGFMHEGRVDVISAGALILARVMLATKADFFIASESDILDGIAWSLAN